MIKIQDGESHIEGTSFDITIDFNVLITQMVRVCPAVLLGVLSERTNTITSALASADFNKIKAVAELTNQYKESLRKEKGYEC